MMALSRFGLAAVLSLGLIASGPASARMRGPFLPNAKAPAEPTQCSFGGWQSWKGGRVDVRGAPEKDAPVVGTLPAPDDSRTYPIYLDITGTAPGWLRIANASDTQNEDDGKPHRTVYGGEGWVRPGEAKIGIQSGRGYLLPDASSQRILDLHGKWLTEVADIAQIRGCNGEWILLDYFFKGNARDMPTFGTAWFRGVCDVYETTCDMKSVDTPE